MNSVIKLSSPQEFWEIAVLFEDEHMLALDKPAGLLTSPHPDDASRPNLMTLLHAGIAENKAWARERGLTYLNNAHRLDQETSGVLLLAKTKPVFVALADMFGSEMPVRKYVALVQGEPAEEEFQVNAKLGPHPAIPEMFKVDPREGKQARTKFKILERFSRWTLVQCELLTDRPHQVRVHLQNTGVPIVGDKLYGGKPLWLSRLKSDYRLKRGQEERPLMGRVALHAEVLSLSHPITAAPVTITAPWPRDLKVAVKYLKQYAG